ncbi:MAG: bifunctional NADH-specific enoyl-ACP reductase/trans-2-enoyl-CoA reductase, partial [Opitutaceae bacterium]
DWELWIAALDDAGLLASGATTFAYDYIGPEVTWPIYHHGSIGRAKLDLRAAGKRIDARLKANGYGRAFISVNKALVTQASSAIPVVPLYISILYKIMKEKGLHEGTIEQIHRLFSTQLYNNGAINFDAEGRARIDDLEMRTDVQHAVKEIWPQVTTGNLAQLTDIAGYQKEFLKLFGFGLPGVDYDADAEPNIPLG